MCARSESMRKVREAAACLAYACLDSHLAVKPLVEFYNGIVDEEVPEPLRRLLDGLE